MRRLVIALVVLAPVGLAALLLAGSYRDTFGDDDAGENVDTGDNEAAVDHPSPSPTSTVEASPTPEPPAVATAPPLAVSTMPPAATASPVEATPAPLIVSTFDTLESCRIPRAAFNGVGFGVPRFEGLIPSAGTVTIGVVFVDFDDVPASRPVHEVWEVLDGPATDFYRDNSYGRLEFVLRPELQWFRLSRPSAYYGASLSDGEQLRQFIQEAVDLADPVVDFAPVDLVLVVANPEAEAVPFGPVFNSIDPDYGYQADGKLFPTGITSGHDLNFWGGIWLAHELGHTMTLPDLYAFQGEPGLRFTGSFGIMGDIAAPSPGMFAFERWMLGWLDDPQISCHGTGTASFALSPIEVAGGPKAVMIPVSPTRVVVVESRRRIGYDVGLVKEGALVYVVDSSIWTGDGPLVVAPGTDTGPFKDQAPLGVGETFTTDGVTVTVTAAGTEGDTIRVEVAG